MPKSFQQNRARSRELVSPPQDNLRAEMSLFVDRRVRIIEMDRRTA